MASAYTGRSGAGSGCSGPRQLSATSVARHHQVSGSQSADILQPIAEVSIGVAGFTSVVAVLGRRATGEWSAIDRFRLSQMLATSLAALLLSLLPLVLAQLGFSERLSWGSASTILAGYTIFLAASSRRRIRQLPSEDQLQI